MQKKLVRGALPGLFLSLLVSTCLFAQEWSAAQKEVWKTVETMWEQSAKGDVDGELASCDEELTVWLQNEPLPSGKPSFRKWITYYSKIEQTPIHEVRPVVIKVFPEFAIVHYYVSAVTKAGPSEKGEYSITRITDVFRKKGDKWFWIAGHNDNYPR